MSRGVYSYFPLPDRHLSHPPWSDPMTAVRGKAEQFSVDPNGQLLTQSEIDSSNSWRSPPMKASASRQSEIYSIAYLPLVITESQTGRSASMTHDIFYRRAEKGDIKSAHALFYRSFYDYLFRIAMVDEETAKNPPIASGWQLHSTWFEHLCNSAAENWVAEDRDRRVVGWAMSVERDDHVELTHFFVEPGIQAKGIGGELIKRAFPDSLARHKAIIATQDPKALALYLRSGVNYVTTSVDFIINPHRIEPATDLFFDSADANDDAAVEAIAALELDILGHRRDIDTRFLLGLRPAWLARRAGSIVGFAFGTQPKLPDGDGQPSSCGPIAATDASDVPAILDHVINAAAATMEDRIRFAVPLVNHIAVAHLLRRGAKIDPFYVSILASENSMRLDRWIHTTPLFIM